MSDTYWLSHGSHKTADEGRCAMEWVAYLAGESHSDQPVCVSPVLRRFSIALNDRLGDEDRQQLRPYLARCIGTAGDGRDPERLKILTEFVLRDSLPRWLDEADLIAAAQRVRELPLDLTMHSVRQALAEVRQEAVAARTEKYNKLRRKIRERWPCATAATAAAAAATTAATAAVAATTAATAYADAAAYTAAYAAVAAVAATTAADVAAYAAAYADAAYADAAYAAYAANVAAYAAAYADAAAAPSTVTYEEVYAKCKAAAYEALKPWRERALADALKLFDRMLPTEVIQLPVVAEWPAVCEMQTINE